MTENNDFEFKYVAPTNAERREIESIRNSYISPSKFPKKLERLRALDNKVKNIPTALSLVVGVVGLLIFGLGMAMVLEWNLIIWGVLVSMVGLAPIILAFPTFTKATKILKEKYRDEILSLSEELLNENEPRKDKTQEEK